MSTDLMLIGRILRRVVWVAAWLCLLLPWPILADVHIVDASGQRIASYASSHALVIGVSNYTADWDDLPSIPRELRQVSSALRAHGFEVEMVINPNEKRLRDAVDGFIETYGFDVDNRLLVFFAGHGYSRMIDDEQRGYLVPADAPRPSEEAMQPFLAKAVSMVDVVAWARTIESRHVLFVFDSCFSGAVLSARSVLPEPAHIDSLTGQRVRQFITSGSAGQQVPGTSLFVPALVQALAGAGDLSGDNYVTGTELWIHLHQLLSSSGQTPQHVRLLGYEQGDFVFQLPYESPPKTSSFDLRDLEERSAREARWAEYQRQMEEAFRQAERVESLGGNAETKAQAWDRFLNVFATENLFSEVDAKLRRRAEARRALWREQAVLTSQGSPALIQDGTERVSVEPTLDLRLRFVPAGSFQMGSPVDEPGRDPDETLHRATLTRGFWMSETEITQGQWKEIMGSNPSFFANCGEQCPVEGVSWFDAVGFVNKLSQKSGLPACYRVERCVGTLGSGCPATGRPCRGDYTCEVVQLTSLGCRGYRLPTEAEWELAARSEESSSPSAETLPSMAWFRGNSGGQTHQVGQKVANERGLFDLLGLVREWTWDWWSAYASASALDPVGPESGAYKVVRGCGWDSPVLSCRAAYRFWLEPDTRIGFLGFRVVRSE